MKEPKPRPRNGTMKTRQCQVRHLQKPDYQMVPGSLVRPSVSSLIAREHPDWSDEGYICLPDLHRYRMMHVQAVVAKEVGELSDLEHRVLDSLNRRSILAEEVLGDYEGKLGPSDLLADQIASFGEAGDSSSCFLPPWSPGCSSIRSPCRAALLIPIPLSC